MLVRATRKSGRACWSMTRYKATCRDAYACLGVIHGSVNYDPSVTLR